MYAYDFVAGLVRGGKDPKKGAEIVAGETRNQPQGPGCLFEHV